MEKNVEKNPGSIYSGDPEGLETADIFAIWSHGTPKYFRATREQIESLRESTAGQFFIIDRISDNMINQDAVILDFSYIEGLQKYNLL